MPTKTRYTVTHPDGSTSTRVSARTYTGALVATPADPRTWAATYRGRAQEQRDFAQELRRAQADGKLEIRDRGLYGATDDDPTACVACFWPLRSVHVYANRQRMSLPLNSLHDRRLRPTLDVLNEFVDRRLDDIEAHARNLDEVARTGPDEQARAYQVLRWSSRSTLLVKASKEFAHMADVGHRLEFANVHAH